MTKGYTFVDHKGTFKMMHPEKNSYAYFPIANEAGVMSCVTPSLDGDCKMGQDTFLLEPVSSENLHNNKSSRNFWVYIEGMGAWSATGVSALQQAQLFTSEKEDTSLEAGVMWHRLKRRSDKVGLEAQITSFVPSTEDTVELMKVTLTNIGSASLNLRPTAAIPLYGRSATNLRDHRHVTSLLHRIKTTAYSVLVNPTLTFDERGHKVNTVVYGVAGASAVGKAPEGFFPIVEDYIGEGGSFEVPAAIIYNEMPQVMANASLEGYEAMGGLSFEKVTLKPQERVSYIIAMGFGKSEADFDKMVAAYLNEKAFDRALDETKRYWEQKINISYHTKDQQFDNWMYWVNFQPMLRRIYGCSFLPHHDYGKGGRGWRDLWQDCIALLAMDPSGVRKMLIDNFAGVRFDGTNATIIGSKQGEFIADRNNITRVWMDHGAWPFLTTNLYIQQSGDLEFLLEKQTYFKDLQIKRGTAKDELWSVSEGSELLTENETHYEGTILEHLLVQHLTAFYDVGEHNNFKLHGADWNDALDMADEKGESVAFTALYAGNMKAIAQLLNALKVRCHVKSVKIAKELQMLIEETPDIYENVRAKNKLLSEYCKQVAHNISGIKVAVDIEMLMQNLNAKADWLYQHIRNEEWITNTHGYSWYNGYYDNHGMRVEGDHEKGTRMMLTSQVFTIMNSIATKEQVAEIVKAADHYLYDQSVGGYKLNTDFKEIKTDLGRMFGFAYGTKENGAVFSHMAVMYANALYERGFVKEGFKVIDTLYKHCIDFERSKIYPGIPEYINGHGRGLYHYLTGAASWLMHTVVTQMFGVKGEIGDLVLQPKLLLEQFDKQHKASISLNYAGKELEVEYINNNQKQYGLYKIQDVSINEEAYEFKDSKIAISRKKLEELATDKKHKIKVILN